MRPLFRHAPFTGLILSLFISTAAIAVGQPDAARLYQRGDFEHAAQAWGETAAYQKNQNNHASRLQALLGKAEALRALGRYPQAADTLSEALELANNTSDSTSQALILNSMGNISQLSGKLPEAEHYLNSSLELSGKIARHDLLAAVHNNLGNLRTAQERYLDALAAYELSAQHSLQAGNPVLRSQALSNAARAAALGGASQRAISFAQDALGLVSSLENSHDKAFLLLSLGQLQGQLSAQENALANTHKILTQALAVADAIGDARSRSYALGYLAQLYEQQGRDEEALELDRRAIAALQQVSAPEIAYRWYWQQGRLKKKHKDFDAAIADYRMAVYHLQSIRADMPVVSASGKSSFREVLGPLYFDLADLLLQRAATTSDKGLKQSLLKEARTTIELSKAAELQDYFQDSCVAAQQSRAGKTTGIGAGVAVIYPILLPDRMELLADFSDGIVQFTSPVVSSRAIETIRDFRTKLEKRTTREYLPYSQELYGWLIRPLEAELAARGIKTLVFIPDGALRTIPMAALHDGREFLIARYAVATTPSLALTDIQSLPAAKSPRALLNGLTQAVQGFAELPNVAAELQAIGLLYGGKTLKDQEYVVNRVENELDQTPYSVVHIASHGQFQSDVKQTFLLSYDGKLTMDNLEKLISPSRYREQPISLLTLSACQTAAGDDRAALGLAGVAVKAGARSALASLWFINDQSASMLVSEFYQQLHEPGMSKANALQNAQLKLMADKRFNHPSYWSPFLLIGNWL